MNYEQKHQEDLEAAKGWLAIAKENDNKIAIQILEKFFPELRESEDEQHCKWILEYLYDGLRKSDEQFKDQFKSAIAWLEKQGEKTIPKNIDDAALQYVDTCAVDGEVTHGNITEPYWNNHSMMNAYKAGWLEKQGEQKSVDNVEPKFKVGDWITNGEYNWTVTDIQPLDYILQSQNGDTVDDTISYVDEYFHLWTIQDANDGDILMANAPFIFNGNLEGGIGCPGAHCGINTLGKFQIPKRQEHWTGHTTTPATKEQCDLLFSKMKEAGYEWDAEKKELKKIEQKPAWSEEDEKMISLLIKIFEINHPNEHFKVNPIGTTNMEAISTKEILYWLKSIKPQNRWKPSKEQMQALFEAKLASTKNREYFLGLLYEDLKKL